MTFDCVFDSYAWIEYFRGSKKGKTVKKFIENEENTQHIEAAKIIRVGIPSLQNTSLNELLIDI